MLMTPRRKLIALVAALSAGTVLQYTPTGCGQYAGQVVASTVNFCAVLNCSGSAFFNFCSPQIVLIDCPTTE